MKESKNISESRGSVESVHKWPRQVESLNEVTKQEILRVVEQSIEQSSKLGMNCAERTFAPICQAFEKWSGFSREIIRIASGLGGGGANTAYGLCGAVTGGLMALGIFWGRVDPIDSFRAVGLNSVVEANKNPNSTTLGACVRSQNAAGGLVWTEYACRTRSHASNGSRRA
jgi:hypothetical protein